MDKSLILRDIKKYLGFKKDSDFAEFLGIKQNTLSNWKTRNTIDYDLIISKCEKIDANWLLTGKGSMLKTESNGSVSQNLVGDNSVQVGGSNNGKIKNNTENQSVKELQTEIENLKALLIEKEKQLTEKEKQISKLIDKLTK